MIDDLLYKASVWGNEFHSLNTHEALGAGSAGPGKSFVLLMDPMAQIAQEHARCANSKHPYPLKWGQSKGWALHLRREFPQLKDTLARAHQIFMQVDPEAHWSAADHMYTFSSGYKFEFGHCRDTTDYNNYLSRSFTHVGYDELTQFEEEQYHQINTRLRSSDPLLINQLKIRAMSNPIVVRDGNFGAKVSDPMWVRSRFVDPEPKGRHLIKHKVVRANGEVVYKTRIYLPATLYDNPDPEFIRSYEIQLLDKPAHIRQAMLYGNWYATPGSYYGDDWLTDIHVCKPFRIPDHWKRFRSLDWGFKQPGTCLWFAVDEEENLWVEREYTFQNKDAVDVAKRIAVIEKDLGLFKSGRSLISGPADTQLWEQRGERALTKAAQMLAHGIGWVPATKDRTRSAQLLLGRLRDHAGRTKTPGIVFFETCVMLLRTLPTIMAENGDPETPQDGGEDHWHDACCYGVAHASHGATGIGAVRRSALRDEDDEEEESSASFNGTRYSLRN
jgi:hypothetical protein